MARPRNLLFCCLLPLLALLALSPSSTQALYFYLAAGETKWSASLLNQYTIWTKPFEYDSFLEELPNVRLSAFINLRKDLYHVTSAYDRCWYGQA